MGNESLNRMAEGAARSKHLGILKFLILKGANSWQSIAEEAAMSGSIEILKYVCSVSGQGKMLIKRNFSILMQGTVRKGRIEMLKFLLLSRDLLSKSGKGETKGIYSVDWNLKDFAEECGSLEAINLVSKHLRYIK